MDSSATLVNGCRWAWCRLTFSDSAALVVHVVHDHVRRTTPVRRRDIPLLRRTEEGLGESLRLSDVMRDPSATAPKSQDSQPSQQPPSSSLPSPPASSPQNGTVHEDLEADETPTSSASPSFSRVRRQRKRSPGPSEPRQSKRPRQSFLPQNTVSPASSGSHRSVEDHLTQTDQDIDNSMGDARAESPECSGGLSSQPAPSQEDGPVQHLETSSQPPSQLHLPSFPHNDKPSPQNLPPTQTEGSSLALPLSGAVVLSCAPDFAISTPQRQNWYQPSLRQKAPSIGRSRHTSTENTPNPSGTEVPAFPSIVDEGNPPHIQLLSPRPRRKSPLAIRLPPQQLPLPLQESTRPVMTPLSKRTGFRSGTFQIERQPSTPVRHTQRRTPSQTIKTVSYATDADDDINKVTDADTDDVVVDNSLSESDCLLEEFQLQSQAPYQSQLDYSQL